MPKRPFDSDDSDDELRESSSEAQAESPKTKKRRLVEFEPVRICSIGSVKEIDQRVLRAQHYKLCERFRYKHKIQQQLEKKIEAFERRQVQDDAVNCTINRHWNRLDADLQILLRRFEEENPNMDSETKDTNSSGALQGKHFLNLLAQWSCEELDEKLKQRVEFSQRTTAKLIQICTQMGVRNSKLCAQLQGSQKANSGSPSPEDSSQLKIPDEREQPKLDEELRSYATSVFEENGRLQKLANELQAENHRLNIQISSHDDKVALLESQVENLNNDIEDLRFQLRKSMHKEEKLDYRLAEYIKKENALQVQLAAQQKDSAKGDAPMNGSDEAEDMANLSKTKLEELQLELELQTELASNRLTELQEVTERNKSFSAELENCKMKLKYISPDEIKSSTEYRCLQTCFTSLYEDCKLQMEEIAELKRQIPQLTKSYEEQIASMKANEMNEIDRLQQTVLELDNQLNMAQRESEDICMRYEANTVSKKQARPIKDHYTSLLASMTTHKTQLKQEVVRLKRKCAELEEQLAACQKEMDAERRLDNENYLVLKLEENSDQSRSNSAMHETTQNSTSPVNSDSSQPQQAVNGLVIKKEEPPTDWQNGEQNQNSAGPPNSDHSRSRPNTPADLAQAKATIQQLCLERDCCREKLLQLARTELQEKRGQWTKEQRRKQKQLAEQCEKLRLKLQNAKREEDGLMQEMESTGQAFEALQEQNKKLLEQLGEKEDANLKLMSERIKNTLAQKKLRDEKELLEQTIQSVENQLAVKMLHCQKLEEKERALTENKATLEQELRIREQNSETLKKRASEHSVLASDLRLRLDRLDAQFNELRENVVKKASTHESDANKIKRLEEERSSLKRRLDRAKKMEKLENIDQVIQEENRILRESMICPSCKVRKKNAILDKCHHVFCFECIRQRYDNRRRKCPKCNAGFGANDYHRIYLD